MTGTGSESANEGEQEYEGILGCCLLFLLLSLLFVRLAFLFLFFVFFLLSVSSVLFFSLSFSSFLF